MLDKAVVIYIYIYIAAKKSDQSNIDCNVSTCLVYKFSYSKNYNHLSRMCRTALIVGLCGACSHDLPILLY